MDPNADAGAALRRAARQALRRAADAVPPLARARDARLIRARMRAALGRDPDLGRPASLNEIVAWKALTDRDPMIRRTTDKLAAREVLAARGLAHLLVPLAGGPWRRAGEIPWDALPDRFVLKASHGSGMTRVVADRARADRAAVLAEAARWLEGDHYAWTGEWGYRGLPRRLYAERMLEDEAAPGRPPPDHKFFVFHGEPRLLHLHLDRFGDHRMLWFALPGLEPLRIGHGAAERADPTRPDPAVAAALAPLAARIARGFALARVDLYWAAGRPWFGEITHYPGGGVIAFDPPDWDRALGRLWQEGRGAATGPLRAPS
jgi:hypothetical protein